jgi:3-methyladenine DNA glycosylase AlkD
VGCEKLKQLAASSLLWERRIAMVATYAWIRRGESEIPFAVADDVMCDSEDLIHKATGWMLREVGKRCDQKILKSYLLSSRKNDDLPRYRVMPRTMLRYAIEHFSAVERRRWLLGKV